MDIAGGCESQAASQLRPKVTDNVAKKIAGDDDIELARIAHDFHGQGINIEVARFNFRIFLAYLLEDTLPEIVSKGHGVRFVTHAHALQLIPTGVVKGVADDALDALAGINVFLNGDFVWRVFLEEAADSDVKAFGILTKDREADVVGRAVAQRGQAIVKKFDRAGIHKEIEFKTQPEKNVRGVLVRRNAWIAECAEKDGVEF